MFQFFLEILFIYIFFFFFFHCYYYCSSTFANGAKQFVVQEAFDTTKSVFLYFSSFTPITKVGVLSLAGAEIITFLAPFRFIIKKKIKNKNKNKTSF